MFVYNKEEGICVIVYTGGGVRDDGEGVRDKGEGVRDGGGKVSSEHSW